MAQQIVSDTIAKLNTKTPLFILNNSTITTIQKGKIRTQIKTNYITKL